MNFFKHILSRLFNRDANMSFSQDLYWQIVAASRNPEIYGKFAIPDTLDGRFDSLMLHLFLVIHRLQALSEHKIADELLNFFTKDMDRSLRETGVGDPSITRKMRKIGEAYMGRVNAYGVALDDPQNLYNAIHKNIYRQADISEKNIRLLTNYVLNYKELLNNFVPRETLPNPILN
jgi:cytochrome b pre-mRNA-processing protein 3